MAAYGWRRRRAVDEGLFAEGHQFSFLQAVRLLETMHPERTPPGEGMDPAAEVVRFRSAVRLDFPPGDVDEVKPSKNGGPAEMSVHVLGLAGLHGPLPPSITELVMERTSQGDKALRDFLDLFNHRLVSLLYRARKKYRPALDPDAPGEGRIARTLLALIGLGTPGLANRMGIQDRSLLPYAGFLLAKPRPTVGLVRLLEDCFGMRVEISERKGSWHALESGDVTLLGSQNHTLGVSTVLGSRVWDQAAGFEVRLGPLTYDQFLSFLPDGHAYRPLASVVRFYVRQELDFNLRLSLKAQEVPELRLGPGRGSRLGRTTWLKTKPFTCNDSQVRITGQA
ncbi:MAG TPA: type VI secretion system baseplate subunit TssG [Thermoanaerobaculia bacterium]|jgi:type VI secretion system protein ImpH|nr:type VI secretion system baseplate subunit TssG [Thermoanaerobaculia bacterium]